ncbi:hypothetical protein JL39_12970 [Rhizobium sp. YS-1r]|nr:hypothetical protein JL39_12970 [Rhizobium sp. YS-1r]
MGNKDLQAPSGTRTRSTKRFAGFLPQIIPDKGGVSASKHEGKAFACHAFKIRPESLCLSQRPIGSPAGYPAIF